MKRIRKQTEKGKEYNAKKHRAPPRRAREVAEDIVISPDNIPEPEPEDDKPEVLLDEGAKVFKKLKYERDALSDKTKAVIDSFPPGFLPIIMQGLIPLLVEKKVEPFKVNVSLSALNEGKYHTKRTNSDKNIASGIKTLLKLPELAPFNKDDLTEMITHHRLVFYTILKNGLEKRHSVSTIKGYLVKLVRLLFIAYNNRKTAPIYTKYAIIMHRLGAQQEGLDNDNTLNENEEGRYLDWSFVEREQTTLKEKFDNTENKDKQDAYALNLDLVLVSLYSLTPPLRKEVMALQFRQQGDKDTADYVYFKRDKTILDLNLNKKRHDAIDIPISTELSDILKQSLALYPRRYLFTDARKYPNFEKPLTISAVANKLRKIFIKYGVNIGPSILRASYVTNRFNLTNWRINMNEIEEMATLMRTSAKYILSSYRKNIKTGEHLAVAPAIKVEAQEDAEASQTHVQRVVDDPYVKHNKYLVNKYHSNPEYREKLLEQQKEYRDGKGTDALRRTNLISTLKRSQAYREAIKKKTLDKYNITEDDYM